MMVNEYYMVWQLDPPKKQYIYIYTGEKAAGKGIHTWEIFQLESCNLVKSRLRTTSVIASATLEACGMRHTNLLGSSKSTKVNHVSNIGCWNSDTLQKETKWNHMEWNPPVQLPHSAPLRITPLPSLRSSSCSRGGSPRRGGSTSIPCESGDDPAGSILWWWRWLFEFYWW